MTAPAIVRKNAAALRWLRAGAFAVVTYMALAQLGFYPALVPAIIAFAAGVLGLLAPAAGVLVFVVAVGIPLAAGDILAGALFLLAGFATIQYLGDSHGRNFLVIALAFAATRLGAEWAVVVLVGLLLGASEGAVIVFIACLVIEVAGLVLGKVSISTLATGGSGDPGKAIVDITAMPAFGFAWVGEKLAAIAPRSYVEAVTSMRDPVLLIAQPFVWAAGAAVSGALRRPPSDPRRGLRALIAVAAGVAVLAAAGFAGAVAMVGSVEIGHLALATGVSLVLALLAAAASEWVFTPSLVAAEVRGRSAEDADVDELLRMISSAEEELASKHTVTRTVLITDMKAFSRITQELGSTETARLVQRHRDLLIPIIEQAGGHGKSTGGDGLLAAFDSPGPALEAAVRMQQALADYNAKRPGEEEVLIRAGIASGEVVLDKGGKPFLGDALNRAARVMSLADGGQVFTTANDLEQAAGMAQRTVAHGDFRLKNIAQPVSIVEVLWRDDQEARAPIGAPDSA